MATNQKAVTTSVYKESGTELLDLGRVVALISDTTTVTDTYALYTEADEVETAGYAITSDFYLMADLFFDNGGSYLYGVPLEDGAVTTGDADITDKLQELENISDSSFSFGGVLMDSTLRVADQISDDSLASYALGKPYHIMIDSNDATIPTSAETSTLATINTYYNNLSGDNAKLVPNISGFYTGTDTDDDFLSCSAMGIMVSEDFGSQTLKFKVPTGNDTAKGSASSGDLTNAELTFILDKNINVYTGVNERSGKSFIKEGTTLKDSSYVDTSFGAIWIKENLEENIYDLLLENGKVSINATGYALIENKVTPIFAEAIEQGIINGDAEEPYTISFSGDTSTRTIEVTYTYVENVAGHFIENTVTITEE